MAVRWGRLYEGTPAELSLEDAVAELGVPYRTQFPGWKYGCRFFPDFYLPTLGLVIEVDDPSHNKTAKQIDDAERTETMAREWGVRVVRCTNEEALNDPRGTVRALLGSVGLWPLPDHLPTVRESLPEVRRAPAKLRREAKSSARQRSRSTSSRRRVSSRRAPQARHAASTTSSNVSLSTSNLKEIK